MEHKVVGGDAVCLQCGRKHGFGALGEEEQQPRHLAPQPKTSLAPLRTGLDGLIDSFQTSQHALEIFSRSLQNDEKRECLARLANRLTKILAELRKLHTT